MVMAKLEVLENIHKKNTCYNKITLRAENVHHSRFNNQHNCEGLCDHLKRTRTFPWISCNSCTSTLILKLENDKLCDEIIITNQMRQLPIRPNNQNCPWSWVGPLIYTLYIYIYIYIYRYHLLAYNKQTFGTLSLNVPGRDFEVASIFPPNSRSL